MQSIINACFIVFLALMAFNLQASESALRHFQQIIDSGKLRIGVSYFQPWVMKGKNDELKGSEIDMGRRLSLDMNLEARFHVYKWDDLIPALERGEIDIIISGMAVTPARALRVNFSQSYDSTGVTLAANKALTQSFKSIEGIKSPTTKLALVKGTVAEDVVKRLFPRTQHKRFDTQAQARQALLKGEVHALIASDPIPKFLALQYPNDIDVPLSQPLLNFREAFAIRKNDAQLLNFLNAWVVAREADTWIPSTRGYWFNNLSWQGEVQ